MEFYERNEASIQTEKEALEKQASEWGNDAPMLYLQPGSTMVRILPPYSTAGVFFRQVTKHRVKAGNRTAIFACPAAEASQPCAICEKGQALTDTKDEVKMKFARENLRPRTQYLYNVLCYSGPASKKGEVPEFGKVYVMEAGVMVHRQIISLDQDPATGWADVTNPQAGVNLIIKRTGQGLDTKYEVNPHGGGRTDFFADCAARGIDPNTLSLINLDEVYAVPPAEKVEEVASALSIGGGFPGAVPMARPALPTVSPATVAVPAPPVAVPAPPVAVPAPPVAVPAPVCAPAPQPLPTAPQPVVAPPPLPAPPVIPAPPTA